MVPLSFGCGSAVFAAIATLAPSRAARNAMASPMPRLAPEMNSVLPLRDDIETPVRNALVIGLSRKSGAKEVVSCIRVQHPAAGFRKREGCDEEHAIDGDRKDRNRVGESGRVREPSDKERK